MSTIKYEMSDMESLIMEFLWENPHGKKFAEICDYLNTICEREKAKQTINTFIKRLYDKGLISTTGPERSRIYKAAVTRTQFDKGVATTYLATNHHGSLTHFILAYAGGEKINSKIAADLQTLLDNM